MPTYGQEWWSRIVVERGVCCRQRNLPAVMMGAPFKESKTKNCIILLFDITATYFTQFVC
jgi:hypothetical protein